MHDGCLYAYAGKGLYQLDNTLLDHLGPVARAQRIGQLLERIVIDLFRDRGMIILARDFNAFMDLLEIEMLKIIKL